MKTVNTGKAPKTFFFFRNLKYSIFFRFLFKRFSLIFTKTSEWQSWAKPYESRKSDRGKRDKTNENRKWFSHWKML